MSRIILSIALVAAVASAAFAQVPDSISFQGYLTNNLGEPLDSSGVSITFKLYKGTSEIWSETQVVDVASGMFNVLLGKVTDLRTIPFNEPIDLGITLGTEGTEMSPRTPLAAAAYARALPGLYTYYRDDGEKSYNVIGGADNNFVGPSVVGATISGGGGFEGSSPVGNSVIDDFGTVGGGRSNSASSRLATVGGGDTNDADGQSATVCGGESNTAGANQAFVGGGISNSAFGIAAAIGGGVSNSADGSYSTVAGGNSNEADAIRATVGGGEGNEASGQESTVAGGFINTAPGDRAAICGGFNNTAYENYDVIGGGWNNVASGPNSFIGSGKNDTTDGSFTVIAGGELNRAGADHAAVGGGSTNRATATYATIAGGRENSASASDAAIGGGQNNSISTAHSTIAGGMDNSISVGNTAAIGGGASNASTWPYGAIAGGQSNRIIGAHGAVPGGLANHAGPGSFAAGRRARARHEGTFVFTDGTATSGGDDSLNTTGHHQFLVKASGGATIYSDADKSTGVSLAVGGGSWTSVSSVDAKDDFESVDPRSVLEKLDEIPIRTWRYRPEAGHIRHMGPTSQDFFSAFGLGGTSTGITTVDADGVALAAIQGLYDLVKAQQAEIERLRRIVEGY
jgi:hypothetical protein